MVFIIGCTYVGYQLQLPEYEGKLDCIDFLNSYLPRNLNYVNPISEASELNIQYPVNVNNFLKGSCDYFIASPNALIVIEAKSDLSRGFTQLAVELIALDQWIDSPITILYGAVTTGEDWQFEMFYRQEKKVVQDIKLYRVPEELESLLRVLIGIITTPIKEDW